MKRLVAAALLAAAVALLGSAPVALADSIKIAPTDYRVSLTDGQSKKGFVDISNPGAVAERVTIRAMAFRQIDDEGGLVFYADERITAGVKLDYTEVEIGPRETLHLAFVVDGTKLPTGDVYAAILATTTASGGAASTAAQVGTLLAITNGTPTGRTAEVAEVQAGWLQVSDRLTAQIAVKNTADPTQATGFYPTLTVATAPYGQVTVAGPLIFAGRTRTIAYQAPGNYFGPVWLSVTTGGSTKGQLVFAITGYWRWLVPLVVVSGAVVVIAGRQLKRLLSRS